MQTGDRVRVKYSVIDPPWLQTNNRVYVAIIDDSGWFYVQRYPESETVHGPFTADEIRIGW